MLAHFAIALAAAALPFAAASRHGNITASPCAVVSSSAAAALAVSPSATPIVDAHLAYECLNSVPLNTSAALDLVVAIKPYLQWQSDSAYLKNPPADYFYPPLDLFARLDQVQAKLEIHAYSNEYQFQADLYQVFAQAHDGHFVFYPDALTKAFEFGRRTPLVSVSKDGSEIPTIYLYDDIVKSPSNASAVKLIDGVDASTFVQNWAYTASFNEDADAAYNSMFFEKALLAAGESNGGYFANMGRTRYIYPGATITLTFTNGQVATHRNIAHVKGDFTGVVDGETFYQQFCAVTTAQSTNEAANSTTTTSAFASSTISATSTASPTEIIATGYPTPVITTNDTIVSGYYLEGDGVDDVAVLSVLAFESESTVEFQAIAQDFLADAVRDGKKKLVIDLSANGGGYILQGYDLFRQFFPQTVQYGYSRMRENDAFNIIAELFSDAIPANYSAATATDAQIQEYESFFNYRYDLNLTDQHFATFEDKFAPHVYAGDNYTNILRWDLNDPLTTSNSTYGFGTDLTGYGSRENFTQPFPAENIIMLYDGYCASTCTLFSDFMRIQGGVKSIIMGGRPGKGQIQAVGGVKGAQAWGWADVYDNAQLLYKSATPEQQAVLDDLTPLPMARSSSTGLNLRDSMLPDHLNDGLPAQFVYEPADCRLYYTPEMITDVTALWKEAAKAAWGNTACVAGGLAKKDLNHPSRKRTMPIRPVKRSELERKLAREACSQGYTLGRDNRYKTAKYVEWGKLLCWEVDADHEDNPINAS
ncbi:MAG: hypothetical protein M1818_002289 [Claussenomyces sp. TS43310]|nr:MAG: hypothetical protein M1818_002289 [Claussenomyces sp. TS43310]